MGPAEKLREGEQGSGPAGRRRRRPGTEADMGRATRKGVLLQKGAGGPQTGRLEAGTLGRGARGPFLSPALL